MRPTLVVSLPLVIACGPEELPRVETEHLVFHGQLDGACEGMGVTYEREVDRLAHELGRELLEPVDVYYGDEEVERRCPPGTLPSETSAQPAGCVLSDTEVVASRSSLSVFLADALRRQHGAVGVPFVESALPVMLGLGRPANGFVVHGALQRHDVDIRSQLAFGWSDEALVEEGLAMHFMHWMEQAYGLPALQAWLWSDEMVEGTDVEAAFAEATGESIAAAQGRYAVEAEPYAHFDGLCHGLPAPPLPAQGLRSEGSMCCDDPSVEQFQPPFVHSGPQCFTVGTQTEVEVELLAGDGSLVLRPDGCEVPADTSPLVLEPGEGATVTLLPCRWRVLVYGPERCDEGGEVRYVITPSS